MRHATAIALVASIGLLLQTTWMPSFRFGAAAPDVLLVLAVYLGLHQHSVGGAVGAFVMGYLQDGLSGSAAGINAFGLSLVFLVTYLTSRRLWVDNVVSWVALTFLASMAKTLGVMVLLTAFLAADEVWRTGARTLILQAAVAAVIAPPIFSILGRLRRVEPREE